MVRVERADRALPASFRSATYWVRERVVRRPQLPVTAERLIPAPQRSGWGPDADGVQELTARLRADVLVMAKFDIQTAVKLRAAYTHDGLTLAIQPPAATGLNGIQRAVQAHSIVEHHAPGLMPALVSHGELSRGLPYLVERWLDGRSLTSAAQLDEAAPEILAGLSAVHAGYGVRRIPLSAHHQSSRVARWADVLQTGIIPSELGSWVSHLLERNHGLRWSWSHGDMVASNVLRTPTGIALVDWEHSGEWPIMRDAAKLHLYAGDPERTLGLVLSTFHDSASKSSYTPAEELALSHMEMLLRYPVRSRKLAGHARSAIYERQVARQVERLAQVRDAAV